MEDCDLNEKPVVIMEVTMEDITEATIVHIGLVLHLGVLDLVFILVLLVLEFLLVVAAALVAGLEAAMEDFMAKNNELLCANNKSGLVYGLYITTKLVVVQCALFIQRTFHLNTNSVFPGLAT